MLINSNDSSEITNSSVVYLTSSGGYYVTILSHRFVYLEAVLHDTAIFDSSVWSNMVELSQQVESEYDIATRLELRIQRIDVFMDYLLKIETDNLKRLSNLGFLKHLHKVKETVGKQMKKGLRNARKRYSQ